MSFRENQAKYSRRSCLSNRHPRPWVIASMQVLLRSEAAFCRACVTIRPPCWLSPVGAVGNTAIWIQGERLHFASSSAGPHSYNCVFNPVRCADKNPGGSARSQGGGSASDSTGYSARHQ